MIVRDSLNRPEGALGINEAPLGAEQVNVRRDLDAADDAGDSRFNGCGLD